MTRLSKFVSQPLVLAIVTGEQAAVHPVLIVAIVPAGTAICWLVCPEQLIVTVELPVPPLNAWRLTRRDVVGMNEKLALVRLLLLNEILFVVNRPNGPDRYQFVPVPQLMTPVGYCPVKTRLGDARSLNVMVVVPPAVTVNVVEPVMAPEAA